MIERCRDRQRKFDGLEKWPLHLFTTDLLVMLQASLLLLFCGLCRYMWSINISVASTLISFTTLGVGFYVVTVIAGASSYTSPFQSPLSTALRISWRRVRYRIVSAIVHFKRALPRTQLRRAKAFFRRRSLPTTIPLENIGVYGSEPSISLENIEVHQLQPWLRPMELVIIHQMNAIDLGCVSWILRSITDPEALDAAIRFAGEIRWFDERTNADPPYHLIVSVFESCFDSTGTLYPESRDRAYYSGQAMVWIHTLAMCKSEEFAMEFPLPSAHYTVTVPDPDLKHLLQVNSMARNVSYCIEHLLRINPGHTLPHSQWISNLLLHYSWANRTKLDYQYILHCVSATHEIETTIPLNETLNRLLVWCIFLGSPIGEEVLKIQYKPYDISCSCSSSCSPLFTSDRMERILYQLSKVVFSAINGTSTQQGFIPLVLCDLVKLETRPECLTSMAYEWCSVICENRESLQDWESLLLVCLEIGFRHLDFQRQSIEAMITHTEHHRGLVDVVFESQEREVIADLLQAWTAGGWSHEPEHALLGFCTGHLVGLHNLVPFSPRLRRLVIRSVELIGYDGFEGVGVEGFVVLLDHLHVTVEDMDEKGDWARLLLDTIQTSEGAQFLSHWYWELLVELTISLLSPLRDRFAHSPQVTAILTEAQEWSKLECWMGTVWIAWPPGADGTTEEDLYRPMVLLFRQRPDAAQNLEQWMERWSQTNREDIPDSFQRICRQAQEAAQ
jgi:hypothetical protein